MVHRGQNRIKVFVHRKGWDIEAERRFVQFEVILHLCPHLILNLFFSSLSLPQDEKNQVLITNAWLQLVSFYLVSFCTLCACVCNNVKLL